MVRIKPGVKLHLLRPQAMLVIFMADGIWRELGEAELVVTSGSDGTHMEGSLHYQGLALDLRNPRDPTAAAAVLRARLGREFDVIAEGHHIHVEYDPKG